MCVRRFPSSKCYALSLSPLFSVLTFFCGHFQLFVQDSILVFGSRNATFWLLMCCRRCCCCCRCCCSQFVAIARHCFHMMCLYSLSVQPYMRIWQMGTTTRFTFNIETRSYLYTTGTDCVHTHVCLCVCIYVYWLYEREHVSMYVSPWNIYCVFFYTSRLLFLPVRSHCSRFSAHIAHLARSIVGRP